MMLVALATPTMSVNGTSARAADAASSESGAQKKGRWKKDGDRCYFDAEDEGPDQCTPPKPR
jgi:hypothetical protein